MIQGVVRIGGQFSDDGATEIFEADSPAVISRPPHDVIAFCTGRIARGHLVITDTEGRRYFFENGPPVSHEGEPI